MCGDRMISKESHIPLYVQLADDLREQIRTGVIKQGDKLPSETEMVRDYKIARLTIREALGILVNEGLIEKRHGKGTFCKTNVVQKKYRVDILLNLAEVEFIPYYLRSICAVLESENVNIVMGDTRNDPDVIFNLLENAIMDNTDGVIFQPGNKTDIANEKIVSVLEKFENESIPYVMIDTIYKNVPESYVIMDEFQAGRIAADYFSSLGHSSLCVIEHPGRVDSQERVRGFVSGLNKKPDVVKYGKDFKQTLTETLDNNKNISGIFCFNDGVAKKCYDVLSAAKLCIPDDISVISVDDTVVASVLTPSLTSVIHPKENLGKEAAKAILAMISGKEKWPYKKVFQPALALRKSCREY